MSARVDRLVWGILASLALAVLISARLLTPDPRGVGTHLGLGLPACGFLLVFGVPCPACGLTTSFALLARAELGASLAANPLGLPLFVLTVLTVPLATRCAMRKASVFAVIEHLRADRWALLLALALLTSWAARLVALSLR